MGYLETFYTTFMMFLTLPSMAGSIYMGYHVDNVDARRENLHAGIPHGWTLAKTKRVIKRLERESVLTHAVGFACLGLFAIGVINCTEFYFTYIK